MWLDWLVFCDYGFIVSALWCPLATPTALLGFLLPWTWGISSWQLQQSRATAPYLGYGHPSWPWMWISSSQPSCTRAATAPWRWCCSCRPSRLTNVYYSAIKKDEILPFAATWTSCLAKISNPSMSLVLYKSDIAQEIGIKTIPMEKKYKKSKMADWGGLTNSCEKKRCKK